MPRILGHVCHYARPQTGSNLILANGRLEAVLRTAAIGADAPEYVRRVYEYRAGPWEVMEAGVGIEPA